MTQESAEVNGGHVIAPFDFGQNLEATPWNSRGWTFQERLLSRRLIAFADNEMVWYCRNMICREDMRDGDTGESIQRLQLLNLKARWFESNTKTSSGEDAHWVDGSVEVDRFGRTHLVRSGRFAEYAQVVSQYTGRKLTYRSDVLFAFEGLANIFERSLQTRFLFGLPECLFDVALLWRPAGQLQRRISEDAQHFPSWSWAGWEGRIRYEQPLVISRDDDGVMFRFERGSRGEEGVRPLLRWNIWNPEKSEAEPLNHNGRGIPLVNARWPREWEDNEFGNESIHLSSAPGLDTGLLHPHHLIFLTSSVDSFQLGTVIREVGDESLQGNGEIEYCQLFCIVDANGVLVGSVTLDNNTPTALAGQSLEFILFAETHRLGSDGDIEEFQDYIVMLAARLADSFVYERLGLGRVSKEAWRLADSRLKTIILG